MGPVVESHVQTPHPAPLPFLQKWPKPKKMRNAIWNVSDEKIAQLEIIFWG